MFSKAIKGSHRHMWASAASWGTFQSTLYEGAGYRQTLSVANATATLELDPRTKDRRWLHDATRLAVLEMTAYSPAVDRVVTAVFAVEFPPTGGAYPHIQVNTHKVHRYNNEDGYSLLACEVVLLAIAVYDFARLMLKLRQKGLREFACARYIFDSVLLFAVFAGFAAHLVRLFRIDSICNDSKQTGSPAAYFDGWMEFATLDRTYFFVCGAVLFIATCTFLVFFRHNTKVQRLRNLFYMASWHALGIISRMVIVFGVYCFAGNLAFGAQIEEFSTVGQSATTLFSSTLGFLILQDGSKSARY